MKNEFVTYEIAKELKELGFSEICIGKYYPVYEGTMFQSYEIKNAENFNFYKNDISVPLWQQAIDWFRQNHNILIGYRRNQQHIFTIDLKDQSIITQFIRNEHYVQAREQAILKAIELCKNN